MRKQTAVVKNKRNKVVEKSILISKCVQLKLDFDMQVSAWVPKAKMNKPMPQINLTMNVSYDDIRLGASTTEELIAGLLEVVAFLEKNKQTLDDVAKKQQQEWIALCQKQLDAVQSKAAPGLLKAV